MKIGKLWVGLPLIMVFTVVFGLMLISCEQISEDDLLGKWYTVDQLTASEPRVSFEFIGNKQLVVGGETLKFEQSGGGKFTFKTKTDAPRGDATFTFDENKEELTVTSSNAPIKNGKYYQLGFAGDTTDTTVAPPYAYPAGGLYTESQSVTLTAASGATIKYTTNNSDPTNGSTYSSPIQITSTIKLRAIATKGNVSSDELVQDYTISSSSSSSGNVTSSADDGDNTLRKAIENLTADGAIITINVSQAISLKSCIYINQSVIIEGGGVVITRDSSWPSNKSGSFFEIAEGKTVIIRRVHFNKAVETNSSFGLGGGIYNIGTLTLESCIFSENKANYGGAIYSTSKSPSTTVKGCTFYNNSATKWGGAIFVGGGNLFMTGNLFYGNAATDWGPIVDHSTATNAAVYSRGYNVVDANFGTGKTQSGWAAYIPEDSTTATDKKFSDYNVTSTPFNTTNFVPNNLLKSVMPSSAIPGFPLTDFNGEARTWSGAPGAVK